MGDEGARPWLSVVMPLHDGAAWVCEALASIVREVGAAGDVEVVVVDDGSSDDGPARVAQLAAEHPWISLSGPVRERSWTRTTNVAMGAARGEWISVLHQDDVWLPGRLALLRSLLQPGLDVLFTGATFLDEGGQARGAWTPPLPDGCTDVVLTARALWVQNWACVPAVAFRRSAALELGGFDPDLWYTPDWDLWLKLVQGGRTLSVRTRTVGFRLHAGSQTITGSRNAADFREQLELVQRRHPWAAAGSPATVRGGVLSTEVNVALAGALDTGLGSSLPGLARSALRAGPAGVTAFLRRSRIGQRSLSRVRAGLRSQRRPRT